MSSGPKLPPGCYEETNRHGNPIIYYRPVRHGPRIRIRGVPWTPEFMRQYEAATKAKPSHAIAQDANTWGWLVKRYIAECIDFKRLDPGTRRARQLILEGTCVEPIKPGSELIFADFPLSVLALNDLEVLRDRKADLPESANGRVKSIRQVFKWAFKQRIVPQNIARDLEKFKTASSGWHTWTVEEVHQYFERHPVGSKPALYMSILLFLGVRKSDAVRLGKQNRKVVKVNGVVSDSVTWRVHKNRNRKPKTLTLPVLPPFAAVLNASPLGDMTWLVTEYGRPFTDAGIGVRMREWCDQAGLQHCSSHGVRKAGATILAELGATAHQLMSIYGWDTLAQAETYTRAADQKRMADAALPLLMGKLKTSRTLPGIRPAPLKRRVKSISSGGAGAP